MKMPFCDLKSVYKQHEAEFDAAYKRVMESGHYILGPETEAFEKEFASYFDIPFCVGAANGTDAVELALRGMGIVPGDHVATVSHTAVATVAAIERMGAVPVLVDIDKDRFTMLPESLERTLKNFPVKAVLPVHLYGQCADMDAISALAAKYKCILIEDCAQAHGAALHGKKAGTFGDAAAFSFYPTKNLGAFGDGGAVLFKNKENAEYARNLRQYGWQTRYISSCAGFNSRLDEIQSAFLRIRLAHLDEENSKRQDHAKKYIHNLSQLNNICTPYVAEGSSPVWHLFVIKTMPRLRDKIMNALASKNIPAALHYPAPVHLQPAYEGNIKKDALPNTEEVCKSIISLPMYPAMAQSAIDEVCRNLEEIMEKL